MANPVADLTYTIPEAAAALKVGKHAVRRLIDSGELPAMHVGRSVRIVRAALEEWALANQSAQFAGETPKVRAS